MKKLISFALFLLVNICFLSAQNMDYQRFLNLSYEQTMDSLSAMRTEMKKNKLTENEQHQRLNDLKTFAEKRRDCQLALCTEYVDRNNNEQPVEFYETFAEKARKNNLFELQTTCLTALAYLCRDMKDFEKSFFTAKKLEEQITQPAFAHYPEKIDIYCVIAAIYMNFYDTNNAKPYLYKAINTVKLTQRTYRTYAVSLYFLGSCFVRENNPDSVAVCIQNLADMGKNGFPIDYECKLLLQNYLAKIMCDNGELQKALEMYQDVIAQLDSRYIEFAHFGYDNYYRVLVYSYTGLAEIFLQQGDIERVAEIINAKFYNKLNVSLDESNRKRQHSILSQYYRLANKPELSLLYRDSVDIISSQIYERTNALKLKKIELQIESDKKAKAIAKQKTLQNWLLLAGIILVLLAGLLHNYIMYSRKIHKKNIALVAQILEKEKLLENVQHVGRTDFAGADLQSVPENVTHRLQIEASNDKNDDIIFARLEKFMQEHQPYINPNCNRKTLAAAVGTNERYLSESIKNNADLSVSEYIVNYRLKHANTLLLHPAAEYTIDAVAFDSGFGSRSKFHEHYRTHYGITPNEFRKIAQKTELKQK